MKKQNPYVGGVFEHGCMAYWVLLGGERQSGSNASRQISRPEGGDPRSTSIHSLYTSTANELLTSQKLQNPQLNHACRDSISLRERHKRTRPTRVPIPHNSGCYGGYPHQASSERYISMVRFRN